MGHLAPERARPGDLEAVCDLLRRAGLPERGVLESFEHFLVLRDTGRVVGACGLEACGADVLLRSLVVAESYRGTGLGRVLTQAALELAGRLRARDVYLLTTDARAFFARQGFVDCERTAVPPAVAATWEFTAGCPSTSACMRRSVSAAV